MTTALAYSSGVTTLEDAAAQFAPYMVGWQVMLNPAQPVLRTISAVPSATQLQFAGDGVNLAAAGDFYRVFAPPGVMADANGANWGHQHCDVRYGCSVSFGWAGYRYFAPVAGFVADHSGGGFAVHGRQGASINLVGNYHCWNRVYSPYLGRWTTPDPLASPWWNLWDYVGNNPLQYTDPSGLSKCELTIYTKSADKNEEEAYCRDWKHAIAPSDFVNIFRLFLLDNPQCACIKKVTIVGHGGSGCGMAKSIRELPEEQRKWLRSQMCEGASAEVVKCGGCGDDTDIDILTVILGGDRQTNEKGIAYKGNPRWFRLGTAVHIVHLVSDKRAFIVPRDAGVSDNELKRVRQLNRDLWEADDLIGAHCYRSDGDMAKCLAERKKAVAEAWLNYARRGVENALRYGQRPLW